MSDLSREIESHIPALRRYALALLRDRETADDLVQDCLARALSRKHLWRRTGSLRAWLFTILHNLYANEMRTLSRRPAGLPLETAVGVGEPARQMEQVAVNEILRALEELSEDQKQVILLTAVEGLHYQETADALGVPLGTVMSRLARGRANLRRIMETGSPRLRRVK